MGANRNRVRRTVLVLTPRSGTLRWIQEELEGEPYKVIAVTSATELVARLRERSNLIAIVDFDEATEQDIAALLTVRDSIWRGELFALGRLEGDVRALLKVRETYVRPFGSERLRKALSEITVDRTTELLPVWRDSSLSF